MAHRRQSGREWQSAVYRVLRSYELRPEAVPGAVHPALWQSQL